MRWEYMLLDVGDGELELEELNRLGYAGWEFVGRDPTRPTSFVFILKRQIT